MNRLDRRYHYGMKIVLKLPRRVVLLVVVGLLVASVGAGIALARGTATTPIGTGVVVIETNLAYQGSAAAGTGMVLTSSGEVLTNNHVISGATTIKVVVPKTGRHLHATRPRLYAGPPTWPCFSCRARPI